MLHCNKKKIVFLPPLLLLSQMNKKKKSYKSRLPIYIALNSKALKCKSSEKGMGDRIKKLT